MKIVNDFPPIWDQIQASGMNPPEDRIIFTYGDTIYVPSGRELEDHLIVHEETHCNQQGEDPDVWWSRYIDDPWFRIDQECEAYGRQYAYLCRVVKDRNRQTRILVDLARVLSGPTYGYVIGMPKAMEMIKESSNDV